MFFSNIHTQLHNHMNKYSVLQRKCFNTAVSSEGQNIQRTGVYQVQ